MVFVFRAVCKTWIRLRDLVVFYYFSTSRQFLLFLSCGEIKVGKKVALPQLELRFFFCMSTPKVKSTPHELVLCIAWKHVYLCLHRRMSTQLETIFYFP